MGLPGLASLGLSAAITPPANNADARTIAVIRIVVSPRVSNGLGWERRPQWRPLPHQCKLGTDDPATRLGDGMTRFRKAPMNSLPS